MYSRSGNTTEPENSMFAPGTSSTVGTKEGNTECSSEQSHRRHLHPIERQELLRSCVSTLCTPDVNSLVSAIAIMVVHEVRLTIICPLDSIAVVPTQPQPVVHEAVFHQPSTFGLCNSPSRQRRVPAACSHEPQRGSNVEARGFKKREEFEKLWEVFERLGLKDFDGSILFTHRVPEAWEVAEFLTVLHSVTRYTPECFVLAMIYVARLLLNPYGLTLSSLTWRPILFAALMVAHKYWDDEYLTNQDFVTGYPNHSYLDANTAERCFLKLINYRVGVQPSTYASAYFGCRTAALVFEEISAKSSRNHPQRKASIQPQGQAIDLKCSDTCYTRRSSISTTDTISSRLTLSEEEAVEFGAHLLSIVERRHPTNPDSTTSEFCSRCYRCVCRECQLADRKMMSPEANAGQMTSHRRSIKYTEAPGKPERRGFAKWPAMKALFVKVSSPWRQSSSEMPMETVNGTFKPSPCDRIRISSHRSVILSTLLPSTCMATRTDSRIISTSTEGTTTLDATPREITLSFYQTSSSTDGSDVSSSDVESSALEPSATDGSKSTLAAVQRNMTIRSSSIRRSLSFESIESLRRLALAPTGSNVNNQPPLGSWGDALPSYEIDVMDSNFNHESPVAHMQHKQSGSGWNAPGGTQQDMIIHSLGHGYTSELLSLRTSEFEKYPSEFTANSQRQPSLEVRAESFAKNDVQATESKRSFGQY